MPAPISLRLLPTVAPSAASNSALDRAFREHAPKVATVALRILGRADEADDLVQDVFMKAGKWLPRLDELAAVRAWLLKVAVRLAWRRLRMRRWRVALGLEGSYDYSEIAGRGQLSPEDAAFLAEVYRIMDRMPAGERLAWSLGERGIFPPVDAQSGPPAGPASPSETEKPTALPPPVPARSGADWRTLARRGDFTSAYRVVHDKARPAALTEMDDLLLAADVVRGVGHAAEAVPFLEKASALHNSDSKSAVAAFTLGRVRQTDLDDPAGAAAAFARARAIAPGGPLAEDALAREVESSFQSGDKIRARALAEEYIKTWPSGTRLRAVRHFGGLP